jgi:hypothetical protein
MTSTVARPGHRSGRFERSSGTVTTFDHAFQSGRHQGWVEVDGVRHDLDGWTGQRDRSRGRRLTTARQGLHLWVQAQFTDESVAFRYDRMSQHQVRRQVSGAAASAGSWSRCSFVDAPLWFRHPAGADWPGLEGDKREAKLFEIASKYYETIHRHIRAYDPHHLILGDRYNGHLGQFPAEGCVPGSVVHSTTVRTVPGSRAPGSALPRGGGSARCWGPVPVGGA